MDVTEAPAVVVLTQAGLDLARRLTDAAPEAEIFGLSGRVDGADRRFGDTMATLQRLFAAGRPIIGVCAAAGISGPL